MNPEEVRKALLYDPEFGKEIRLNDGTRLVVQSREQWHIGATVLALLAGGEDHFVAFRKITEIRVIRSKRGRRSG